jgi:hypothetical protein
MEFFIMSYKDLEADIKAWANLEQYAKDQKQAAEEAVRQAKREKLAKKKAKKGLLVPKQPYQGTPPIRTFKRVTMEVREMNHRHWGPIEEVSYTIVTISDTEAELSAIKMAKADGYNYERLVVIVTEEK